MDVYKIDETKDIEMIVNSFVSEPATEKEWLYFSDAKKRLIFMILKSRWLQVWLC